MKRIAGIYWVIYMSLAAALAFSAPAVLSVVRQEDANAIGYKGSKIVKESKPQECVIEEIDDGLEQKIHSRQLSSILKREHELRALGEGCLVSAEQVIESMRDSHSSIVDLRPRSEWVEAHIPGSINMRSGEVASKGFLKDASVVLVDKGYDPYALETVCLGLRDAGFSDVKAIVGGVVAWQWHAPMRQIATSSEAMYNLSPEEFISALDGNSWLIVGVGVNQEVLNDTFVGLESMVFDGQMSSITNAILPNQWQLRPEENVAVLLVSPDGHGYPGLQNLNDIYKLGRAYYLKGGLLAYEGYVRTSDRLIAHLNREPDVIKRCGR